MEKNLSSASLLLPQFTALLPKGPAPNHLLISGGRPPAVKMFHVKHYSNNPVPGVFFSPEWVLNCFT